jgi:hypothetical protein
MSVENLRKFRECRTAIGLHINFEFLRRVYGKKIADAAFLGDVSFLDIVPEAAVEPVVDIVAPSLPRLVEPSSKPSVWLGGPVPCLGASLFVSRMSHPRAEVSVSYYIPGERGGYSYWIVPGTVYF